MGTGTVYVCDSTALIDVHRHFSKQFKKLKGFAEEGKLKIPEGVVRELHRSTDRVQKIIDRWATKYQRLIVTIGHNQQLMNEVPRIDRLYGDIVTVGGRDYPGFWHSPAGRKAADAQVVAVGKVFGWTVVSDDRAIRFACLLENVECIGWSEFARRARIGSETGQTTLEFK